MLDKVYDQPNIRSFSMNSSLKKEMSNSRPYSTSRAQLVFPWLIVCLLLPLPIRAQDRTEVTGAKVTEAGIYESKVLTDQTNSAGLKLQGLDQFTLQTSTTNIPARVGTRFGFRYEILGTPSNAPIILTIVTSHPPMVNSTTGKTETTDTYQLPSKIGKTYMSCSLDEKSDCVPGLWTFEVRYTGETLCKQSFLVMPDKGSQ